MDVDRYSETEQDGHAPVANAVWSSLVIPPQRYNLSVYNYLLSVARQLDIPHLHCVKALHGLDERSSRPSYLEIRTGLFEALGYAGSICISLSPANRNYSPDRSGGARDGAGTDGGYRDREWSALDSNCR